MPYPAHTLPLPEASGRGLGGGVEKPVMSSALSGGPRGDQAPITTRVTLSKRSASTGGGFSNGARANPKICKNN